MLDTATTQTIASGIGHVVLCVEDLVAARDFYGLLGLSAVGTDMWPECGANAVFALPSGQHLVLAEGRRLDDPAASAAHVGLAMAADARDRVVATLSGSGHEVFDYREDRPAEATQNAYVADPSGNRLQLVAAGPAGNGVNGIHHVAIEVSDILWAEIFYGGSLGWPVAHRVGWNTQDYLAAKAKGEAGMREAMPGARYWNERYSQFEKERRALRPNPQLYLDAADGTSLAVYLASRQYQAPPDDAHIGVPRLGLRAAAGLERVAAALDAARVAYEGPDRHGGNSPVAASLFIRDFGGNFIEFTEDK